MIVPEKLCITFAGPVGSSKTPIAHFLSIRLGLPIVSNDALRAEVTEDLGRMDEIEYETRREARLESVLKSSRSFLYDASVDRRWVDMKKALMEYGYAWRIVSIDIGKDMLSAILERKGYDKSLAHVDRYIADHDAFLEAFSKDVSIHISDSQFPDRLRIAYDGLIQTFPE